VKTKVGVRIAYAMLLALCVLFTCGDACWPVPQPGTATGGFPVSTVAQSVDSSGNIMAAVTYGGEYVTGGWLSDNSGAAGSVKNFALTTDDDGNGFVNEGRVYANWSSSITWNPACNGYILNAADFTVVPQNGIVWICPISSGDESANVSTHFVMPGAAPSSLTSYADFSTAYGEPQLRVYVGSAAPSLVTTASASSVIPGVSATFPFPKQPNGSPLAEGFYGLANTNVESGGAHVFANASYLAVGGTISLSSAFGVDAADSTITTKICSTGTTSCTTIGPLVTSVTILTQYYTNEVSYLGEVTAVGTEPVAVKFYGSSTKTTTKTLGGTTTTTTTTSPQSAIVVNSGSNSVSLFTLPSSEVKTIAVGTRPMAVTLNSAASSAYVPSYGSGTLSEINLSTQAVSRTLNIAPGIQAVAMDPSGSYVWVGGTNYIYKVSLSTFTVVTSVPVSGSVTSLAVSSIQNELVYTLVQSCCSASSTYAANELALSNLSTPGSYAHSSAAAYAPYTMNGTLPSAAVLPQATSVVSARFSNGMGASSTPTGFVIYDLVTHQQIMTGNTPTPVRGIASDPDSMFAYFTLPDSNEYIFVPLEYAP
jgi:hypothetical protein